MQVNSGADKTDELQFCEPRVLNTKSPGVKEILCGA